MNDTILILNGPNLNMLGVRQPDVYGRETLANIEAACAACADRLGLAIDFRQSNSEGELIGWIQAARETMAGVIINAAALTHTSVGILDALTMLDVPIVEVHLSNIYKRESFRHHSFVSPIATGVLAGFGSRGYLMALDAMAEILADAKDG